MKKLCIVMALAAITFSSVYAAGNVPGISKTVVADTVVKKKMKVKTPKMKKKMKMKDSTKVG